MFDLLMFKGESLLNKPLVERKAILEQQIVPKLQEPLRYMEPIEGRMEDIIKAVKEHGLEGLVAKRRDSKYEPGRRSGAWRKMRVDKTHLFVIGGRTRNGLTPVSRADLLKKMKPPKVKECPFANLPQAKEGRGGVGLTAAKMKDCVWLRPQFVGEFQYTEWTGDGHLRQKSFIGLRTDKKAKDAR